MPKYLLPFVEHKEECMTHSRPFRIFVLSALLAAMLSTPAFADPRLQDIWLWEGPEHKGIIFSGNTFVVIDSEEAAHLVGSFTVSGNTLSLHYTLVNDVIDDLWVPIDELELHNFSFRTNNVLVIGDEVYRRS